MRKPSNYTSRLFCLILSLAGLAPGLAPPGNSWGPRLVSGMAKPRDAKVDSWKPVNTGLTSLNIVALAIDPVNTSTIYVSAYGGGVVKSIDGGATWSNVGLGRPNTTALAIDFVNPNIIYAGTIDDISCYPSPLLKSVDGGSSWSDQSSPKDCDISMIVMDPTSPKTLYAGGENQYFLGPGIILWKSVDVGATWRNALMTRNLGLAPYGLTINPVDPQTLYAPGATYINLDVYDIGLYKSADGGETWRVTGLTNTRISAVAIDPLNPNTLYAGSNLGMLKSADGGANWFTINNGLPGIYGIRAILVDRDNPNVLYVGTDRGGVFKSIDGGANWVSFSDGLTYPYLWTLALAPGNPNTLYAGTSGGGLFKITDTDLPRSGPIHTVSAASFSPIGLASESIATSFGVGLATNTASATMSPLPTQLAGTTVKVKDSLGAERLAPLFFVSPAQVNYQIPAETSADAATITITSGDGFISTGAASIKAVAPSLFTANSTGEGVASAIALRIKADGSRNYEPIAQFDVAQNKLVARPIDLGPEGDQVFLILFGTGIRHRSSLTAVIATIGGAHAEVSYAGAQPEFVGLDQVNALLPRTLIGRGEVDVQLTADARMANTVRISIR